MCNIILLKKQINFVSSFVHTHSLRKRDALTHQLCNIACVKMFQHPSAVLDQDLGADTTSGQINGVEVESSHYPHCGVQTSERKTRTREIGKKNKITGGYKDHQIHNQMQQLVMFLQQHLIHKILTSFCIFLFL